VPHLKLLLGVEPPQLLVVQLHALALQKNVDSAIAEPPTLGRDLPDLRAQRRVVAAPADVADRRAIHGENGARPTLAHLVRLAQMRHRHPLRVGCHHFFRRHVPKHGVVQHRVREQPLQPRVLVLERLQTARFGNLHAAEPRLPLVDGRRADAMPPADVRRRHPALLLAQDRDDLLLAEPRSPHRPSPSP
jgi:hypothetical protein